jgi:hypothetical protein
MAITTNKKPGDSAGDATVGYAAQIWQMADALRGCMVQGQSVQNAQ